MTQQMFTCVFVINLLGTCLDVDTVILNNMPVGSKLVIKVSLFFCIFGVSFSFFELHTYNWQYSLVTLCIMLFMCGEMSPKFHHCSKLMPPDDNIISA